MLLHAHRKQDDESGDIPQPLVRLNGTPDSPLSYEDCTGTVLRTAIEVEVCLPWVTQGLRDAGAFLALYRERGRSTRGASTPARRSVPGGQWVHPYDSSALPAGPSPIPFPGGVTGRSNFGGGQDSAPMPRMTRFPATHPVFSDGHRWTQATKLLCWFSKVMPRQIAMSDPVTPWLPWAQPAAFLTRSGYSSVNKYRSSIYFDTVNSVIVSVPTNRPVGTVPPPRFRFAVVVPDASAANGFRIGPLSSIVELRMGQAPYIDNPDYMSDPYHPVRNPTGAQRPFVVNVPYVDGGSYYIRPHILD